VVFTLDGARLRRHGEIYDSFATMAKHCYWILPSEFETLRLAVKALGVLKAGSFLTKCYDQSKLRVEGFGDLQDVLAPKIDSSTYVDKDDFERLARAEITEAALNRLRDAFETFWKLALGKIGSIDMITLGTCQCGRDSDITLGSARLRIC
jgi:hypothetical protein